MTQTMFDGDLYRVRRKFFSFLGQKLLITNAQDQLVLFAYMKAFKLKEDIRLYPDEKMEEEDELLRITARQVIDFSATYDVHDSTENKKVGSLRRSGWKSIARDEWRIFDADDREIGTLREDSVLMALMRRFLTNLIPQKHHVEIDEREVAVYKQHFNPFWLKITADFSADSKGVFDKRLALAALVLLCVIEGRQG